MKSEEKQVKYTTTNSYATLNQLTPQTKTVWLVFHGMGYLSQFFLKYFKELNPKENYIIAPQAPSKYYIQPKMYVGANWLTKNNTQIDTENILNYIDAVLANENLPIHLKLIVFGYSQGVSIATRYVASRKLDCGQLVLHSGGLPKELNPEDFSFLNDSSKVHIVYGKEDQYLNEERMAYEKERAKALFNEKLKIHPFEGKHEVNIEFINNLTTTSTKEARRAQHK